MRHIQRDVDYALTEHRQHLADKVQIELFLEEKQSDVRKEIESKTRAVRAKEATLRQLDAANKLFETVKVGFT